MQLVITIDSIGCCFDSEHYISGFKYIFSNTTGFLRKQPYLKENVHITSIVFFLRFYPLEHKCDLFHCMQKLSMWT